MKRITILLLVLCQYSNAQYYFHKQWDKRFGGTNSDDFSSFIQANDGGYLLTGSTRSGIGGDKTVALLGAYDMWVVKIDSLGNKEWDKKFGGNGQDYMGRVITTKDGGYLLLGSSSSWIGGDQTQTPRGGIDYWVVKIDANGNKVWDKRFGGPGEDFGYANLEQTKDGGYILGGYSSSGVGGDKSEPNWSTTWPTWDYWIVKIDSLGNKQWDKRYGGTEDESLAEVHQTTDGGYILGGWSKSDISGDRTQANPVFANQSQTTWIVKTDSVGNKIWDKSFGNTGICFGIVATDDSGFVLGLSGDGGLDGVGGSPWIVKVDSNGIKQWEKGYGCVAKLKSITQTSDDGYLISGDALRSDQFIGAAPDRTEDCLGPQNTWALKLDSNGSKQWDKIIFTTGSDFSGRAIQTIGSYYAAANMSRAEIGGYKTQAAWDSSYDYFIVKFCMDTVTGINELSNQTTISVYPNPFTSDISISLKAPGGDLGAAAFTITTLVGQIIYHKEESNLANNYTKGLDLSYLPKGMYLLEVMIEGQRTVKQIIKQ